MRPVLVLENDPGVDVGYFGDVLVADGIRHEVARLHDADPVPANRSWSRIVVLGGEMGVHDAARFPYLDLEMEFLEAEWSAGTPILGVCLGSQLLAAALGGSVRRAPVPEAVFETFTSPAAAAHPVVRHLDGPQLSLHRDTWSPPEGATLLLESGRYPQAFAMGSGLGIQTHPEASPETAVSWIESPEGTRLAERAGADVPALAASIRAAGDRSRAMAERFFRAWLEDSRR